MFTSNYTGAQVEDAVGKVLDGKIGGMTEITYKELVTLRNESKLVPGMQYRITDYETFVAPRETSMDTKSAGHQFDIIVTADSESVLNEKARAIQHEGDTYFANSNLAAWEIWYCLDNDKDRFAWARKPLYYGKDTNGNDRGMIMIFVPPPSNSVDGTVGNTFIYVMDSMGDTWQLFYTTKNAEGGGGVDYIYANMTFEYCIDNCHVDSSDTIPQDSFTPEIGNSVSINGKSFDIIDVSWREGKGVIYRMIDEFGNDCPYDFKNIMFNCTDISSDVTNIDLFEYYYTFSKLNYNPWDLFDSSIFTYIKYDNEFRKIYNPMKNNIIKSSMYNKYDDYNYCKYRLHRNIFFDNNVAKSDSSMENNIIGIKCKDIIITNNSATSGETDQNFYKPSNNNIGQGCENIKISNDGSNNTFINCKNLTITDAHNFYINGKKIKLTFE